jgi:hypothetical protein
MKGMISLQRLNRVIVIVSWIGVLAYLLAIEIRVTMLIADRQKWLAISATLLALWLRCTGLPGERFNAGVPHC